MTNRRAQSALADFYGGRERDKASTETALLTGPDRAALRRVLNHVPGGYPMSTPPGPGFSVRETLEVFADTVDTLAMWMSDHERVQRELTALQRDVDAARRIFGGTLTPKP
jgi:hypothetical protein